MARTRRKKALYEVIGKTLSKEDHVKVRGSAQPEKRGRDESSEAQEPVTAWPRRPRMLQFNSGRIEISMPYQLAIAVLLGIILLILVVFRLGQMSYSTEQEAADSDIETGNIIVEKAPGADVGETMGAPPAEATGPAESRGDNVIVVVEYVRHADLVPVQQHFREHGIETEIVPAPNGKYFLWTKEQFESTDTPGTRGYEVKQEIRQIGALYKDKAPEGYESFAPNYFSDAYGKKIK